jgi:hypothetical protein
MDGVYETRSCRLVAARARWRVAIGVGGGTRNLTPTLVLTTWWSLADGSAAVEVVNFNAPTCSPGEVRGLVEVPVDTAGKSGGMLDTPNCTSSLAHPTSDIEAFLNGFATMSVVRH